MSEFGGALEELAQAHLKEIAVLEDALAKKDKRIAWLEKKLEEVEDD